MMSDTLQTLTVFVILVAFAIAVAAVAYLIS